MSAIRSRWCGRYALTLTCVLIAGSAAAIEPEDIQTTGPLNAAYQDAIWGTGIRAETIYLRPEATFTPTGNTEIKVPEAAEHAGDIDARERWFWAIVFTLVLAAIIYVFVRNAGGVAVSFRRTGDDPKAARTADGRNSGGGSGDQEGLEAFLAGLAAMADKRAALILLAGRTLERAADANGLRLARAQTARDVLRALPREWEHLAALRRLLHEAEVVHFGGRGVPPLRWEACVAAARPILGPYPTLRQNQ